MEEAEQHGSIEAKGEMTEDDAEDEYNRYPKINLLTLRLYIAKNCSHKQWNIYGGYSNHKFRCSQCKIKLFLLSQIDDEGHPTCLVEVLTCDSDVCESFHAQVVNELAQAAAAAAGAEAIGFDKAAAGIGDLVLMKEFH